MDNNVTTTGDNGFDASHHRVIDAVCRQRHPILVADFHDLDIAFAGLEAVKQPAALDLSRERGGFEKVASRSGQGDTPAGLGRRDHDIGQRPLQDVLRQNQRNQFQLGSGTRQNDLALWNAEQRTQTIANTVKPAGYRPLLVHAR